jgi:uncharacterized protein with NAD-binding domain and iron-sulfur cluster
MRIPSQRKSVTIFGAGVAGLTVAHELAGRGFDVEVWEPEPDVLYPRSNRCAVGGMARTQYATVSQPFFRPAQTRSMVPTGRVVSLDDSILFTTQCAQIEEKEHQKIKAVAEKLNSVELKKFDIEIHGFTDTQGTPELAKARADAVKIALGKCDVNISRLRAYGPGYVAAAAANAVQENRVEFVVRQQILPGEHGFRFFPAFYRHIFDTMKRTPIMRAQTVSPVTAARRMAFAESGEREIDDVRPHDLRYVETGRSTFDNLMPTTSQAIAFVDDIATVDVLPRRRVLSIESLWRGLHVILSGFGFTLDDIARLQVKLFKYMTSCSERRERDYEGQSWWDFIDGDSFSEQGRQRMDAWPRALVAMSAKQADARTQGNIIVQLLFDQLLERDYTDGILNGPTSEAWLNHWRTFLEQSQGVRFVQGRLKGFEFSDDRTLYPVGERADGGTQILFADGYYVVALPLAEARRIAIDLLALYEKSVTADWNQEQQLRGNTLQKLRDFEPGSVDPAHPAGALQHMAGIQFYFDEDVQWVNGHIYFPDSEWALTAISQAMFWEHKHDFREGYRGTLSVCISDWSTPSKVLGKCAWQLSPGEIAEEVWRQVASALNGRLLRGKGDFVIPQGGLPRPVAYHLDDNLVFGPDGVTCNLSPPLINNPGKWGDRPGSTAGYEVVFDSLVFAGTYMQTHTRLTTMEAANESARHAVTAILRASESEVNNTVGRRGNLCSIWSPEDHELDDLDVFKALDTKLVHRNLPHFMDILELDQLDHSLLEYLEYMDRIMNMLSNLK